MSEIKLPEPFGYFCDWGDYQQEQRIAIYYGEPGSAIEDDWNESPKVHKNLPLFTADQMKAAILEERERCARICKREADLIRGGDVIGEAMSDAMEICADAIRSQ